jgi:RAB protein geranylgeranyltransferase component A
MSEGKEAAKVTLGGTEYKPLADGHYDVVILGSGFKECLLAGLLAAVGKKKVLQIDRHSNYGGACATLSLKEMFDRHGRPYDKEAVTKQFGRPNRYQCDLIPKFILAGGRLVKMLIQTGVTKYIEFAAVNKSFVFTSGKIYKVPVTPAEALRTSLVGLFQKRHLRNFAIFLSKYESQGEPSWTSLARKGKDQILAAVTAYYSRHNPEKVGEAAAVVEKYDAPTLFAGLEANYGIPVVPKETVVDFGPGTLGLQINGVRVANGKTVTAIIGFNDLPESSPNKNVQFEVSAGDLVSKLNGEDVLWNTYDELLGKIKAARKADPTGPFQITFIKPCVGVSGGESKDGSSSAQKVKGKTMGQLFSEFSLDANSQCFIGHAMALHTDDSYLNRPAIETVEAVHTYGQSVGVYGDSPYVYPLFGLSNIPEGFARLAAVYGGVNMLRTEFNELFFGDDGKVCGLTATFDDMQGLGPEKLGATCGVVIGDPSYLTGERRRKTGTVIRSTCLVQHPINRTEDAQSAQIIMPSKHLKGKKNDVFVSLLSDAHEVTPRDSGTFLAIVSTVCETNNPVKEVEEGIALLGDVALRFDDVQDTYEPTADGTKDNVFVTKSYDATSHFEYESREVMDLFERIMGYPLDLSEAMQKPGSE